MSARKSKTREMPAEAWAFYATHPVAYVEDMILRLTPDEVLSRIPGRRVEVEQAAIMNAVAGHRTVLAENDDHRFYIKEIVENDPTVNSRTVTARSGHGIGKTTTISWLINWFMDTRNEAKVMLTGSKFDQLKITTWAELGKWHLRSVSAPEFEYQAEKFYRKSAPMTWFTQIVTAKEKENITGFHGDHVLIVVDEASAESIDQIIDALMGCITKPDNHIVMLGNATRTLGAFYDAHHRDAKLWTSFHFDSEKSAMVAPEWLEFYRSKYHPDSDIYKVRVKGEFPSGNPKSIIAFSDCQDARAREVSDGDFIEMGVDPAFEGDDLATIATRLGLASKEVRKFPKCTPNELYWHVITAVRDWRAKTGIKTKIRIKVDAHGGYGSALIENLTLNNEDNVEAVPVYSNSPSTDKEYANYGTQMWYEFGALIKSISIPDDDFLIEELSGREWRAHDLTRISIEPKTEFKKRLDRSPDRADAVILSFAGGATKIFQRPEESQSIGQDFEIDWNLNKLMDPDFKGVHMYEVLHIVGLHLGKNLELSGLAAVYEFYKDRLWIYDAFRQDIPVPEVLANQVRAATRMATYTDWRRARVVASPGIFSSLDTNRFTASRTNRPLAAVLRQYHIQVSEPVNYDQFGAIALGTHMFHNDKVVVHNRLVKPRTEIALWQTAKGKPDENSGFCMALLLILSEVRRRRREPSQGVSMGDYTPIYEPVATKNKETAWMTR